MLSLLEADTMYVEEGTKESSTMLDVRSQTGLTLSSKSPRKLKLRQENRKYRKRIAVLESATNARTQNGKYRFVRHVIR